MSADLAADPPPLASRASDGFEAAEARSAKAEARGAKADLSAVARRAKAELCCVDPAQVARIWPHVSHLVRRAMARGGMGRFADVERDVLGANAYLWLAVESGAVLAAAVTQVTQDRDRRLCTIVACSGHDFARWGALIEGLEAYARAENCVRMEIAGRPGWLKRLPDYRLRKIVIRKEL
jgi:hypothetical protein